MSKMLKASTLRPGLLVSLKTSVRGNVNYITKDIEADHQVKGKERRAKWETTRTVSDADEHERATKARSQVRIAIYRPCAVSAFGLLCPDDKVKELEAAIVEAREIADEFNASAKLTRIGVYVMVGRIARDDVEAIRAINSEVRDLLQDMQQGVKNLDAKSIRDAALKAKSVGNMLTADAAKGLQAAIDTARTAARKIVKAGEQAAQEVDREAIKKIAAQRTAFLDLDAGKKVQRAKAKGRAVDLAPREEARKRPAREAPRQLEL